jgi:multicomponent Na+:H+ antiporter subunit A
LRSPLQDDLKAILAYSTLSVLGMLIFLLGIGTPLAIKGMVLLTLAHSLYKAPLFLVAGTLDHETGTRSIKALSGLRQKLPMTFAIGAIAATSMIGLPPMLGFIGKETLLDAFQGGPLPILTGIACVLTGVGLMTAAWLAGVRPFIGEFKNTPKQAHEAPITMWLAPLLLASLAIILVIFNKPLLTPLTNSAIAAIQAGESAIKVKLWHGFTLALFLSVGIIAAGIIAIQKRDAVVRRVERWRLPDFVRPSKLYQWGFDQTLETAGLLTRVIQSDSLRINLGIIMTVFLVIGGATLLRNGSVFEWPGWPQVHPLEVLLGITMLISAFLAMRARTMMKAAVSLGVVGFSMSAVFLVYGAVDLAITQIVVDTLTVLIFVLVVHKLPKFKTISSPFSSRIDILLAALAGLFMTLLVLKAEAYSIHEPISGFFNENSVPKAYGRNIVNVILVDFRALDTFGEITVLMIAAMGVYLLVTPFRKAGQGSSKSMKGEQA